jgi:glycolate oxidase
MSLSVWVWLPTSTLTGLRGRLEEVVGRDYVLGVQAVLPTGEIIRSGGRLVKDVAGYDLRRLLCGSEGTLR